MSLSVSCVFTDNAVSAFLLENGALYHIAHSVALAEYLATLHLKPEYKQHPYVSIIGEFALHVFMYTESLMHLIRNYRVSGRAIIKVGRNDSCGLEFLPYHGSPQGGGSCPRHQWDL